MFRFTEQLFEDQRFPTTSARLIDRYGELELPVPNGSETVGDALRVAGTQRFDSPEDARLSLHAGLSRNAIGRYGYSDRDAEPPGTDGHESLSF